MVYKGKRAKQVLTEILAHVTDNGRYPHHEGDAGYYRDGKKYVAFDNSTCDCWVEEFPSRKQAVAYVEDCY